MFAWNIICKGKDIKNFKVLNFLCDIKKMLLTRKNNFVEFLNLLVLLMITFYDYICRKNDIPM